MPSQNHNNIESENGNRAVRTAPMPPATHGEGNDNAEDRIRRQQLLSSAPPRSSLRSGLSATGSSARDLRFADASASAGTNQSAQERLAVYKATMGRSVTSRGSSSAKSSKKKKSESLYTDSRAKTLVPLLALQAYHLPGNTWCQDWWQFMTNNHPVFGICCHHPMHPIGACTRVIALVASVIFGLALTNMLYLFFLWNPDFNQTVVTVIMNEEEWELTTGMMLLWTVGGSVHASYNLLMWHIAACACCRPGGCLASVACCPSLGKRLIRVFLLISISLGALIVLLRVGIAHNTSENEIENSNARTNNTSGVSILADDEWALEVGEAQEFNFLLGYLVEMILALFIYYPLGGTILFSGCLGCGRIPVLGGRPAEVAAEERHRKKRELQANPTGETLASTRSEGHINDIDVETANEQDIELVWTPQAVRDFERDRR